MENKNENKGLLVRNLPVLLAFIMPIVILIVIYIGRGIFPFGDQMYLRSDMYHQYAPFLKEFQSILKNGDSLSYTWNIGLGTDLVSTYSYYLASPVNWLVALLPADHIPEIMSSFIILKAGLMSATFAFYIQKHFGRRSFIASGFGIFYGLSSYMAAYSWNLMWLDCLVLLPLITLGLERLVKDGRVRMYTITLAVSIFSNYYISIMICIFLILYFFYFIICEAEKTGMKEKFRTFGRFAFYSVLAALMAAAILFPTIAALSSTASGDFSFPTSLRAYYNIMEMVAQSAIGVEVTMISGYVPNVYCTVALFLLIPLFWISKKISFRERIGKTVLMGIFVFSFALNVTSYIWHGFHYPNSLPSRQSFIYIFLILVIGCQVMMEIKEFRYREMIITAALGIAVLAAMQLIYGSEEDYPMMVTILSVCFVVIYAVWAILAKYSRLNKWFMIILLLIICASEAFINTEQTGYSTTSRTVYTSDNEDIEDLIEGIGDDSLFYRIEKVTRRTKNDGAWENYMSASEFSSSTPAAISDLYEAFGMQSSMNSFSYYGHTPLVTAILGVKYEIAEEVLSDSLMSLVSSSGDMLLYENEYALSLGFMVSEDVDELTDLDAENPFAVQESFISAASGLDGIFEINSKCTGSSVSVTAWMYGRMFVYVEDELEGITVTVTRNGAVISQESYDGLENPQIVDIGDVQSGDVVEVVSDDDSVVSFSMYSAIMDYDALDEVMEVLGGDQYEITVFDDDYISGTIHAEEGQVMFTSIPYTSGWTVYVDGEEAEISSFKDAFIMVGLEAGDHTVEFVYSTPCFALGVIISILAIIIFINFELIRRMRRRDKNLKLFSRQE